MNLASCPSPSQRRLISIFKQFIDKALIPPLRSNDSAMSQWQYFSSLLNSQTLDLNKLQIYVDVLSSSKSHIDEPKKEEERPKVHSPPTLAFFKKKDEHENIQTEQVYQFNPSKTFGGERARPAMFPLKQQQPTTIPDKDAFLKKPQLPKANANIPRLVAGMESIYKMLSDNQMRMEQATGTIGNSYKPYDERKYM